MPTMLHHSFNIIIESVDSICRDTTDTQTIILYRNGKVQTLEVAARALSDASMMVKFPPLLCILCGRLCSYPKPHWLCISRKHL